MCETTNKARYFQGKKAYSCNYCAEQCSFAKDMQNHVKVHKINKCPLCDEKYGENKNKADHLLKEHSVEEIVDEDGNVVQTHTCTVCWKKYKKRSQYNSHITVHRPVKCRKCFLQFDRDEIPQHLKEVHNDMSLTCGICGYQVYKNSLLLRHQRRVHLNERNLTCHICNMELFANGDLKKHLVKHNPVKIFECAHCQKKYPRRTTFVQHLKIHMGDKKVCPICEQRFVQKASLNCHMIMYHPETC
ncbi:zinc finger and BTB domain-containing protein 17-like [Achroia grisella]|uniref:zinc finger and BTB domain-containing protein 17-like n=1 Tax=Achroia grisella TaxID=688607 RepID=UPI0027D33E0D|nr:zinc finger and BTB domain-containing protein 17-like [Achroia grisella]